MYDELEALWPQLMGVLVAYLVVFLVFLVLQIVAWWRIFTKAGEKGWKCLIPIYNGYIQYKIAWDTTYFWLTLLLPLVVSLVSATGVAIGGVLTWVAALASLVGSVALVIISITLLYRLSQAFGHGVGFTLGLLFLQPIFILILGLGGDQYQGNPYAHISTF